MNKAKLIIEHLSTSAIMELADSISDLTHHQKSARQVSKLCEEEIALRRHDTIVEGEPITDEKSMGLWVGNV